MAVFTDKQINDFLKEINNSDLIKMFNSSVVSFIKTRPQEEVEKKLTEYWEYELPVTFGDIVEINNVTYVVTCIYTDNSVDLLTCGTDIKKKNIGLYGVDVKKVGTLQCIVE